MRKFIIPFLSICVLFILGISPVEAGTTKDSVYELISGITELTEDALLDAGYEVLEDSVEENVLPGDIFFIEDQAYAVSSETEAFDIGNDMELVPYTFEEEIVFYRYKKEVPEYEAPTGLKGFYSDPLSSISLPEGFTWTDPGQKMENIGVNSYTVEFQAENALKYETVKNIPVAVQVEKKKITIPEPKQTYSIRYGTPLSKVPLPAGWDFIIDDEIPEIGSHAYTIQYLKDSEHFTYIGDGSEREIRITVTKAVPKYQIPATIRVKSGTVLDDSMLPTAENGTYTWNSKETVTADGLFYCTFTPNDTDHYLTMQNIAVSVRLKAEENPTPDPGEEEKPETPEPTPDPKPEPTPDPKPEEKPEITPPANNNSTVTPLPVKPNKKPSTIIKDDDDDYDEDYYSNYRDLTATTIHAKNVSQSDLVVTPGIAKDVSESDIIVSAEEAPASEQSASTEGTAAEDENVSGEVDISMEEDSQTPENLYNDPQMPEEEERSPIVPIAIGAAVIAVLAAAYFFYKKKQEEESDGEESRSSEESTSSEESQNSGESESSGKPIGEPDTETEGSSSQENPQSDETHVAENTAEKVDKPEEQ